MVLSVTLRKLSSEIKSLGEQSGADIFGIASTEYFNDNVPIGHSPFDLMPNAKSVIICACGNKLNEDRDYSYIWEPNSVELCIKLKDRLGELRQEARNCIAIIQNFLHERGYASVVESHGWSGMMSFKMVAYLSGIGVWGKGGFIVNPEFGVLNVLACIVTDAPLENGAPLDVDVCGTCTECIKNCVYGAYTKSEKGYDWNAEKCRCYDLIMNPITLKWMYGPCNSKCVNVCPIGKK